MASAVNQNFRLQIGEDRTVTWSISGADFTGDTVAFYMATHELSSANNVLEKSGTGGDGTASVTIADTDTDSLNPGVYYYELKVTESGVETVVAWGNVDLAPARTAN